MKAKLIVEGREFPIEIQDPELQKLLTPQKQTGYERVGDGHTYSFVSSWDEVQTLNDEGSDDDLKYECANYYSDRIIAENNARADKLMRQLRRFAVEHRKSEIDWNNESQDKYYIYNEYNTNNLGIAYCYKTRYFGCIYFDTEEAAKLALDTFHDELVWYFTEYKDSL